MLLIHMLIYLLLCHCLLKHKKESAVLCLLSFLLVFIRNTELCNRLMFLLPVLVYASFSDLETGEIPDLCSISLFCYGISCCRNEQIICACIILGTGTVLSVLDLLGFGDVKLCASWTLTCGMYIFTALFAASLAALCISVIKKESASVRIPFAPFLAAGFIISCFLF